MALKEHDIRPAELDAMRRQAQEADIAWLRERSGRFVDSDCPACGAAEREPAYDKLGFTWMRCASCATAYMTPRPDADLLGEFYHRSELYKVWNAHVFPASREARRERIFKPRVERTVEYCARHGLTGGTLVEVGAAHGMFCEEAKKTGVFDRVIAIEPSAEQAATCRALGLETIEQPVEAVTTLDGEADVVASFEAIEHLSAPQSFVEGAARMLRPGGLLVLTTPNVEGFDVALLGAVSDQVYPEHVTLFSLAGLKALVEKAGLELAEHTTPGALDADIVRNKVLAGQYDLTGQPFLQRVLIDEWETLGEPFQAFLAGNRLSSHMWLIARKPGGAG